MKKTLPTLIVTILVTVMVAYYVWAEFFAVLKPRQTSRVPTEIPVYKHMYDSVSRSDTPVQSK